jgi:hypothetical protein
MHQNNFGASDYRPKILGLNIAESDSDDNFPTGMVESEGGRPS